MSFVGWLICAVSYYRVFGAKRRKGATRKLQIACFRMAIFRPATRKYDTFHASPFRLLLVVSLPGGAKCRHAKTRQNHHLAGFRVATFLPAWRKGATPNGDVFVFSHGDLSLHHTKVRDIPCDAFSATVCRNFAWRGERSPRKNPPKSSFGGFSHGDLSRFRPLNTLIQHGTNQPP